MTSEELERAIETLLNNRARCELQLERTDRQIERTDKQIEQTNKQLKRTNKQLAVLAETQNEICKAIRDSIGSLSKTVERHISEGRDGKS